MNLVKKILDQKMRERKVREGGSKASKVVARLLVTKFRDKYFSYSQCSNVMHQNVDLINVLVQASDCVNVLQFWK